MKPKIEVTLKYIDGTTRKPVEKPFALAREAALLMAKAPGYVTLSSRQMDALFSQVPQLPALAFQVPRS